jgi:Protein of unknown function (DUF2867)
MSMEGRLPTSDHRDLPWKIHDVAPDFRLIDAWALPATGSLEDFRDLCQLMAAIELGGGRGSKASRALVTFRRRLGSRMGWDDPSVVGTLPIPGCTEVSLRERLPAELAATIGPVRGGSMFHPVFKIDNEAVFEHSNSLLHALLHLGWVPQADGRFKGQLGVYVKHRSAFGPLYMAAIAPFRHHIIYPDLLRWIGSAWTKRTAGPAGTTPPAAAGANL